LLCFKYSKKYQTNFVKVKFIKDVILNCKRCCFRPAQKTSDVSQTSDVWENQQSFYNQSFVQQWIVEAEKGEQGAV